MFLQEHVAQVLLEAIDDGERRVGI
jgi:hypothetical protein